MRDYPYPMAGGVRSIALGIIFSFLTCGIYSLYWQYKQMAALNGWLGRTDYRFGLWLLLSFVTCGIYSLYYEYLVIGRCLPVTGSVLSNSTAATYAAATAIAVVVIPLNSSSRSNALCRSVPSHLRLIPRKWNAKSTFFTDR